MAGGAPVATLEGWQVSPFTGAGLTYDVYEKGSGPGVVLIPEVPGLTPQVLGVVAKLCVSAEFRAFATHAHRPITDFFRAVAADLASRTPASGVGVIGTCFTGGFALATAVDGSVLAAVMSQPAVPFPLGAARSARPARPTRDSRRPSCRPSSTARRTMVSA